MEPDKFAPLLDEVWQRNLPRLHERLSVLDRAAHAAAARTLTPLLRDEANMVAHKLSGSLGMFGHLEATNIARRIEHLLAPADPPADPHAEQLTRLTHSLRQTLFPPA